MRKLNLNKGTTEHCETEFCPCGSEIPWLGDLDPEVDPMSNETNTTYCSISKVTDTPVISNKLHLWRQSIVKTVDSNLQSTLLFTKLQILHIVHHINHESTNTKHWPPYKSCWPWYPLDNGNCSNVGPQSKTLGQHCSDASCLLGYGLYFKAARWFSLFGLLC